MTKVLARRQALVLRQQGKSYSQIKKTLGVSKSTLSLWLQNYPLTKEQIDMLRGKNPARIEKYRATMIRKKQTRLDKFLKTARKKWLSYSKRELFIAGLFLYWGEGSKSLNAQTSISNTNPKVLKFALYWLNKALRIPKEKIRVFLHLYKDMEIDKELRYWSNELKIPLGQFGKPYIKASRRIGLDQKGFGHGTCNLAVNNARLKERIIMTIEAISDHYSTIL